MLVETETKITENGLGNGLNRLTVEVRHDNDYEYGFVISLGCSTDAFTSDDLRVIIKCLNKALRVRKAAK